MSPYDAPAVYSLLQYTEFAEGIWYPRGGFNMVVQKLEQIATSKYGANFIYNAPVAKINTDDQSKKVTGVTLENGTVIEADAVVCNADLVYAYHHLLPPCSWTTKQLAQKKLTSSSISFYWSLSKIIPELDVHNIFLAEQYKESFNEIFQDHSLPSEASFYVNVPSRIDPSAAPDNRDAVIVLVPIGHIRHPNGEFNEQEYNALVNRARKMVLAVLEKRLGVSDFKSFIDHEIVNHPGDWQQKFNLWRGSILGLSHDIFQVLWFRPSTKDSTGRYDNLFFVGASTHPGTGVPIVLAGSKLTSEQVCDYFHEKPKSRQIDVGKNQFSYQPEVVKHALLINFLWYWFVSIFVIMFAFFTGFPKSSNHTPASFINSLLPPIFQVVSAECLNDIC